MLWSKLYYSDYLNSFFVRYDTHGIIRNKFTYTVLIAKNCNCSCIKDCGKEPNTWNPRIKPFVFSDCEFKCTTYRRHKIKGKLFDKSGKMVKSYSNIASFPIGIGEERKPGQRYKLKVFFVEKKKGEFLESKVNL